jgi:hypothetical protein
MSSHRRPHAELVHHFEVAVCDEANCGVHLIARRENNDAICELVIGKEGMLGMIEVMQNILYAKIAIEEDKDYE